MDGEQTEQIEDLCLFFLFLSSCECRTFKYQISFYRFEVSTVYEFKAKIKEDKLGLYIVIPPKIMHSLKLKKGGKAIFKAVPKGKKFVFQIIPA